MQTLRVIETKQFKKSFKKYQNNKKVIQELRLVVDLLINKQSIPIKYRDHELTGNYKGIRELHLKPDDLLLYFILEENNTLTLVNIGSHTNLFD